MRSLLRASMVLLSICSCSEIVERKGLSTRVGSAVTKTEDIPLFSQLAELPEILTESSGIELAPGREFWSFNDRKGNAELYRFDTLGSLKHTLKISGATNEDWEDISKDDFGNVYIGDFGNNDNERRDLTVYKVADPGKEQKSNEVSAEKIRFSFPDQTAFPPPKSERFFDVEGMFAKEGYLYLLTKDRSKPFVGKTKLYRLPNTPGAHTLEFLDEFLTDKKKENGQVTGADLSPDHSKLAMLCNGVVWLFRNIPGDDFFAGELTRLDLPLEWDWEAIVFEDNCTLYLTNEEKSDEKAMLYRMKICE